jgi:lipopolysaccharide/colanic/teichoic acid biosynthesis glycosyltransferase
MRADDAWFRTLTERFVAALVLIILTVPIALTALVTRVTLGSPTLFRQKRVGLRKQLFTICKFRTMHNTRDSEGKLLPDHARETSVSRFMRRIRVDEFPQLMAIAGGQMSFIGPRPLLPETIEAMGLFGNLRCRVRPGLSGWAQVNGNTKLSPAQKLNLDLWYIDHRSLKLDLLILFKTLATLMSGERINQRHVYEAERYVDARYGRPETEKIGRTT